jgi:nucleoside-diphosphate-sugar epimerase
MARGKLFQAAGQLSGKWAAKGTGVLVPSDNLGKNLVIIPGVNGVLGKAIRNGLVGQDDNILIVGGTRRELSKEQKQENAEYQGKYSLEQIDYSSDGIAKALHRLAGKKSDIDSVTWINTVGGGHPEDGRDFEDLNVKPVQAACDGLRKFREETGKHISMIHLSSHTTAITPEGVDSGYTDSRHKAEKVVKDSGIQGEILRLGIVVGSGSTREEGGKKIIVYNTNYEFSPENLANSSIAATLGSHDMPVQYVHSSDIAEASLSLIKRGFQGKMSTTNAVSDDMTTQGELYAFHAQKQGKSGASAVIPLPAVSAIVDATGGVGRLTPYAVGMAASDSASTILGNDKRFMSPDRFTEILGKKPTTLSDIFQEDSLRVDFPPSSIPKLLKKVMEIHSSPEKMQQAQDAITNHGGVYNFALAALDAGTSIVASEYKKPDIPLGSKDERRADLEEMRRRDQSYDDKMPTIDVPYKKDIALNKMGKKALEAEGRSETVFLGKHNKPIKMKEPEEAIEKMPPSRKGTVVVLGGKSQLGKAVVKKFMSEGYNVVITTRGKKSSINEGARYHEIGGIDLENSETGKKQFWDEVFTDIESHQGKIKCVVNCAGEALAKSEESLSNINRRPVKPMLDAAVEKGIQQFTYISTKGAAVEESFEEGGYSLTKRQAELDILNTKDTRDTNTTIIRPDLLISANNPGHFGGPQIMSGSSIKFTAGSTAENAGNTLLKPVSTHDVAEAIFNITDKSLKTPEVVTASGPEEYSYSDLLNLFKDRYRDEKFVVGLQVPVDAVAFCSGST